MRTNWFTARAPSKINNSTSLDPRPPDKTSLNNFCQVAIFISEMKQKIALIVDLIASQVKPKEIFYRSIHFIEGFCGHNIYIYEDRLYIVRLNTSISSKTSLSFLDNYLVCFCDWEKAEENMFWHCYLWYFWYGFSSTIIIKFK